MTALFTIKIMPILNCPVQEVPLHTEYSAWFQLHCPDIKVVIMSSALARRSCSTFVGHVRHLKDSAFAAVNTHQRNNHQAVASGQDTKVQCMRVNDGLVQQQYVPFPAINAQQMDACRASA